MPERRPKISTLRRAEKELMNDPAFLAELETHRTPSGIAAYLFICNSAYERAIEIERKEALQKEREQTAQNEPKPAGPEPSA